MKYDVLFNKDSDSINPYERIQIDLVNTAIELNQKKEYDLANYIYLVNHELQEQLFSDGVSNHILKVKENYDNYYHKAVKGINSVELNNFISDWKQIRNNGEYNESFNIMKDIAKKNESLKVNYSLKEKIKYYKKRVNDDKLTHGQRIYAKKFLENNGIRL